MITRVINLNSPAGNVFELMATISDILTQLNVATIEYQDACSKAKTYDEIVAISKEQIELCNKQFGTDIQIISTPEYQMS